VQAMTYDPDRGGPAQEGQPKRDSAQEPKRDSATPTPFPGASPTNMSRGPSLKGSPSQVREAGPGCCGVGICCPSQLGMLRCRHAGP